MTTHREHTGKKHAPNLRYEALLVLASAIWGFGTIVIKDTVDEFPTAWLVGIRFLAAGILLSLVLLPRMRRSLDSSHLKAGAVLGAFVALTYLCNTTGLAYTTASRSSFLTATYCILVPFLAWRIMRKKPTAFNVAAALLCLIGVGLVASPTEGLSPAAELASTGEIASPASPLASAGAEGEASAFSVLFGDALTLLSAVFCGLHIVLIAKFAPGRDMLVLTALQFLVAGVIALACAAFVQAPPSAALFTMETLGSLAYLIVPATCMTLAFQNIGLAHVAPAPASLLLSTEAVFGVIFSVALLGETLTAAMVTGFALIFAAILISEWLPLTAWGQRLQKH